VSSLFAEILRRSARLFRSVHHPATPPTAPCGIARHARLRSQYRPTYSSFIQHRWLTSYLPDYSARYFRVQLGGTDYLSLAEFRLFGTETSMWDFDGDGIPDYIEDANGDGSVNGGETAWTGYNSPTGLVGTPGLQVYTPFRP
jgi:hypothetical protein